MVSVTDLAKQNETEEKDETEQDLTSQFSALLSEASPDKLKLMIDFLSGNQPVPQGTISERSLFDPTMARKEIRARDKRQAAASNLDEAPNGGVFLTADGTYVNYDGKSCNSEGRITSNKTADENGE